MGKAITAPKGWSEWLARTMKKRKFTPVTLSRACVPMLSESTIRRQLGGGNASPTVQLVIEKALGETCPPTVL